MRLFLVLYLMVMTSLPALSKTTDRLAPLFASQYHEGYVSGRCGDNILKFLRKANAQGIKISDLSMVIIENKGFSGFGMVNVEAARDSIRGVAASSEKNWYHHVIAVDGDGFVYDFDFTEAPRITDLQTYAETMFLNELECTGGGRSGEFCIGRKDKLTEYHVQIIPAEVAITGEEDRANKNSVNLQTLLSHWKALLQRQP